jgi:hypothetical protein
MFSYDLDTHRALAAAGARTNVALDVALGGRVVVDHKAGVAVLSGPGPLAAAALADALDDAARRRWADDADAASPDKR